MCVDKGSSYCLSHVVCECLPDVTECSKMQYEDLQTLEMWLFIVRLLSRVTPSLLRLQFCQKGDGSTSYIYTCEKR